MNVEKKEPKTNITIVNRVKLCTIVVQEGDFQYRSMDN